MGWERKRGKLHELNLLLRGSEQSYRFRRSPATWADSMLYKVSVL